MLPKQEVVAMLLAGGQGSRLGVLTRNLAKPAVPFGGKYRIIDFPLSNCVNSGIETVGVLTQYQPLELNDYIGNGQPWDLDSNNAGVHVLPPYQKQKKNRLVQGTANAIYQNIPFIERIIPIMWWFSLATTSIKWIIPKCSISTRRKTPPAPSPCTRCPWRRPLGLAS